MTHVILVPVFNEAPSVGAVVADSRVHGPVLVIDDGSNDTSAAEASAAGAEVIRHPRRLGKGRALRTGFAAARARGADRVVTVDGDGQHPAAELPRLLAAADQHPDAIIVGSRLGGANPGLSAGRRNAVRIASFFVTWVSGLSLADTHSGFRVYPRIVLDTVHTRRGGFVYETEVLIAAALRGHPIVEVPITARPRERQRSRFRPLVDGAAIGTYLAARTLGRWACELGAAGPAADAGLVTQSQRTSRSVPGRRQTSDRERTTSAVLATLAAPPMLGLVLLQTLADDYFPDVVSPLVSMLYAPSRLTLGPAANGDRESDRAATGLALGTEAAAPPMPPA
jgi:Glycosyl transferase family 2